MPSKKKNVPLPDTSGAPLSESEKGQSAAELRTVALFETAKGVLVLVVGLGLLSLVHKDVQATGEEIVRRFHLNLAHHTPRIFIDAAAHIDDARLRLLALAALLYSAARFVEAYGLWRMRAWAEWFAIISGAIFLPVELYELFLQTTVVKAVVLVINFCIVGYLIYARMHRSPRRDMTLPA